MSASWKCAICGTVITSKCPSHRSEFYSMELSVLQNVVTINRVVDVKNDYTELFLSYSGCADKTTAEQFRSLSELLMKDTNIESLTCDHVWVINSTTNTTCTLDHEHPNLNNLEEVKERVLKGETSRNMTHVMRDFSSVVDITIDQARKFVNVSKKEYDHFIESEFRNLKQSVANGLQKLAEGKSPRPMYRSLTAESRWGDNTTYAYFETEADAIAFLRGSNGKHTMEKLGEKDNGYQSVELDILTTCIYCGKLNIVGDEIIVKLPEGQAHLGCMNKDTNDKKIKTRYNKRTMRGWVDCSPRKQEGYIRDFGLDAFDIIYSEEQCRTSVYIKGTMPKAEFDITCTTIVKDLR